MVRFQINVVNCLFMMDPFSTIKIGKHYLQIKYKKTSEKPV